MSPMDAQSNGSNHPEGKAPLFPDVGVIGIVPDRWDAPWQPRHHVLSRLAQWFHVVWVEPAQEWRHLASIRPRGQDRSAEILNKPNGLDVYTPEWWLPHFYKPSWLVRWSERQRLRRACARLRRKGCRRIVLYLWRPDQAGALDAIPHAMSCYHIDDEYSFSTVEQPNSEREIRLLERVDQVFIHSPGLFEKKGYINPRTLLIPNGVDYGRFSAPAAEPDDMAAIRPPRVGYVGYIKTHLDFRLMIELAQEHPAWSFVFVGPEGWLSTEDEALLKRMKTFPNMHFLGGKPSHVLPAYAQRMDVCIMPYKINDYTKYIFPLKLHEYLATGRPVVGAPIRSLKQFEYAIALPTSSTGWSRALAAALEPAANTVEQVTLRHQVARRHDWTTLVSRIAETVCGHIGKSFPSDFSEKLLHNPVEAAPAVLPERRGTVD